MTRIAALKPDDVPAGSKPTLDAFTKTLRFTPNMMASFAASPIAFNAWATLRTSMSEALDLKTRESISLAVSEVNGCNYCLAVHTFGAGHAKMSADEIILARKGHASEPKRDAAVQFSRKVIETRGQVSDADLKAVRDADYTDANIIEIVTLVAMYADELLQQRVRSREGLSRRSAGRLDLSSVRSGCRSEFGKMTKHHTQGVGR
ncbi:alkylhydroperoxidase AhpD family core domain protein [Rhizobium leguminosarum bv. trifolii WSM2297]|uniref:Alkylhydroperoxidase AhpD family core domain protein n=1 Tax=Rhizobium leguminosarum bv. trifolii WSM2297 TaxID=754762 RepID=J0CWJ2_RHILT|nr:alkylhydroperoxidase AhpD family core domain protein [Rhizobium leguminosarum bv. trifolii WSM2297]